MGDSPISLVEFATDDRLIGGALSFWPEQVGLLRGLEDEAARVHCWSIARQCGKSTLAMVAAIHNAVFRPDLDVLPKRRKRYVLIGAASGDQAREDIAIVRGLVEDMPLVAGLADYSADRVDFLLPSGRRTCIRAVPTSAKTVRGMSASLVIFEEMAHFDLSGGPGSDERMWRALRPSLRRFGAAGRTLCISTPGGESGRFFELFRDCENGVLPGGRAVQAPAWEIDPGYTEAQREADRAELGEDGFREEVGAEFVAGRGTFMDLRDVRFDGAPVPPEEGRNWRIGLDAAFSRDRFGIVAVGEHPHEPGVLIVGAVAALDPGRSKAASRETFQEERERQDTILERAWETVEPYAAAGAIGIADSHKGGPVKSFFGAKGMAVEVVQPNETLNKQRFVALRSRLEDGTLRCWPEPGLLADLRAVRSTDTDRIHLPRTRGGHCDSAVALAAAAWALRHAGPSLQGSPRAGGTPITAGMAQRIGGGVGSRLTAAESLARVRRGRAQSGRDGRPDPDRPGHVFPGGRRTPQF